MKTSGKKIYMAYLILILSLVLAGCGGERAAVETRTDNKEYVYVGDYQIFTTDDVPYRAIFAEDGTVFYATYKTGIGAGLYYLPYGESSPREISLEAADGKWITGMGRDLSGNLLFAYSLYKENLEQLELMRISEEGEILERVDVTAVFAQMQDFEAEHLLGDEEGNYYIGNDKSVYVISPSGNLLYELKSEKKIWDMFFTREKDMMLFHMGELEEIVPGKRKLRPVNSENSFKDGKYEAGREKELIYSNGNSLYTCDIKDKEPVELLNWVNNDIISMNLKCFTMLEDGRIAAFTSQSIGDRGESELAVFKKTELSKVPQKKTLTYGCAFVNSTMSAQIVRYNKLNKEYRVEIKQYGNESTDVETRKRLLQTDIISGKGPDILDIGIGFSEEERSDFIEMGILEDLNPYFEKDEEIQREDYLEQILKVYERDNCLYAVMPSFGLQFLAGKVSDIGENNSWDIDEMMAFMDSLPKEKRVLPGADRQKLLEIFLTLNMGEFINWETGECFFGGAEFRQLLEFVFRFPGEEEKFYWAESIGQIRSGEIPLLMCSALSVNDLQTIDFMFGEPANAIGYPVYSGNGVLAFPCTTTLGMSSSSDNKEGAWELIRYLLEENQQYETGMTGAEGFPVNRSALDRILEKSMEIEYEKDDEGNLQEKTMSSWSIGSREETEEEVLTIHFYAATEGEVNRIRELIDSVGNNMETSLNREVMEIVSQDAAAYFAGQKSVDEVMDMMQDRIQIYSNEQK